LGGVSYNERTIATLFHFHKAVKKALIKDGWTIIHDPLIIRIDTLTHSKQGINP